MRLRDLAAIVSNLLPITDDLALVLTNLAVICSHLATVVPDLGARMRRLCGDGSSGSEDDNGSDEERLEREHEGTPPGHGERVA